MNEDVFSSRELRIDPFFLLHFYLFFFNVSSSGNKLFYCIQLFLNFYEKTVYKTFKEPYRALKYSLNS